MTLMRIYCKFNTMMTTSLFFILYGERPVQRLRYCETRICSPTKIKLRLKVGRFLERLATLQNLATYRDKHNQIMVIHLRARDSFLTVHVHGLHNIFVEQITS